MNVNPKLVYASCGGQDQPIVLHLRPDAGKMVSDTITKRQAIQLIAQLSEFLSWKDLGA